MYEQFFGLKEAPFSIAPNPDYLYMSEQHKEALAHLLYGVSQDGGFAVLTGEVGTGKTTVCRCFLDKVPESVDVVFILNSKVSRQELLETFCDELGIRYERRSGSCKPYVDAIFEHLLSAHSIGRKTVLVIDEAQNLTPNVLEQVRLLTNLETNNRKLLQIVLVGQPELHQLLTMPQMRQLSQRVTARYHLSHLDETDVWRYICHRLEVAGVRQHIIPQPLVKLIMQYTGGIPRLINVLCDRMLLGAFVQRRNQVTAPIVRKAALEIFGPGHTSQVSGLLSKKVVIKVTVACMLFLMAVLSFWLVEYKETTDPTPVASVPNHTVTNTVPNTMPKSRLPSQVSSIAAETEGLVGEILALYKDQHTQPPPVEHKQNHLETLAIRWPSELSRQDSEVIAMQTLLMLWGRPHWIAPNESLCDVAERMAMGCYSHQAGSISELQLWNRPAMIELRDHQGGRFFAVVEKLSPELVSLRFNQFRVSTKPELLDKQWEREFNLFWLPPPNYYGAVTPGTIGPLVTSFTQQLGTVMNKKRLAKGVNDYTIEIEAIVRDFQRQEGLEVDGVVGMQTLMRLNEHTKKELVPTLMDKQGSL